MALNFPEDRKFPIRCRLRCEKGFVLPQAVVQNPRAEVETPNGFPLLGVFRPVAQASGGVELTAAQIDSQSLAKSESERRLYSARSAALSKP